MRWEQIFTHPSVLPFVVAIVAILTGGVIAIAKLLIVHRERMAKIERGIDPDHDHDHEPDEK